MCYPTGMVGTWKYRTTVSLPLLLFHGDASVTESTVGRSVGGLSLTRRRAGGDGSWSCGSWGPACEGGALAWGLVPWGRTRQPAKDDQHSLDETSGQQGDDRRSEGGGPEDVAASATCALPSFVSRARQGSDWSGGRQNGGTKWTRLWGVAVLVPQKLIWSNLSKRLLLGSIFFFFGIISARLSWKPAEACTTYCSTHAEPTAL